MITINVVIQAYEQALQEELIYIIQDLIKNYDNLGLRASGEYANSLEGSVNSNPDGYELLIEGSDYAYFMENGRQPTKKKGKGDLKAIIRQWIDDKKIVPNGISKDDLAFLITRKIHQQGIKVPNKYNKGGVISDVIEGKGGFVSVQDRLQKRFNNIYISSISSDILKNLTIK